MKPSLIIMAAGLGTRYKGGIKALEPVGSSGELLFDYGVYDALEVGFQKIIIVLRKEIEADFMRLYGRRIDKLCARYGAVMKTVLQNLDDIPCGSVPEHRQKPWGTCHAVLAAREEINGPFCVMNADDYYGKTAFKLIADYLVRNAESDNACLAGFRLFSTLSDYGSVTRGICDVNADGFINSISETRHIIKKDNSVWADGICLEKDAPVSMNIWGFGHNMMKELESGFRDFLSNLSEPLTEEFLLPVFVNRLISEGKLRVRMLSSPDKWFGMTYSSDRETTKRELNGLVMAGKYPVNLYADV